MPIVKETTWRIDGSLSDTDFEWIRLNCQTGELHQERDNRGPGFLRRYTAPPLIYTICTTISDRQETLLMLKFSDRIQFVSQQIIGISND